MWKWNSLKRLLKNSTADEISSSACIMWPVVDGDDLGVDEPHITAIYLGDVANLDKDVVLDVMRNLHYANAGTVLDVKVTGVKWFGPEQDVPVLTVSHISLDKYREYIEDALAQVGIENGSEYKEYKPHITVSDYVALTDNYNSYYFVGAPELWWGREHIKP